MQENVLMSFTLEMGDWILLGRQAIRGDIGKCNSKYYSVEEVWLVESGNVIKNLIFPKETHCSSSTGQCVFCQDASRRKTNYRLYSKPPSRIVSRDFSSTVGVRRGHFSRPWTYHFFRDVWSQWALWMGETLWLLVNSRLASDILPRMRQGESIMLYLVRRNDGNRLQ